MSDNISLGLEIRRLREKAGLSLVEAAKAIGITRSHLNKIELDQSRPSQKKLKLILDYFGVDPSGSEILKQLASRRANKVTTKETQMNNKVDANSQKATTSVAIDPNAKPVLYSESVFIQSSDFGLTMDFAQRVGLSDQQFVVARIGMSFEHANKMIEVINDQLQKHERV